MLYFRWLFSDIGCTFAGFWIFLLAQNDMNTHAAIAVYRYIIICQPSYGEYMLMHEHRSANTQNAIGFIGLICIH